MNQRSEKDNEWIKGTKRTMGGTKEQWIRIKMNGRTMGGNTLTKLIRRIKEISREFFFGGPLAYLDMDR